MQEADAACGPLISSGKSLRFTESGKYSTKKEPKDVSVTLANGAALNIVEGLTF